MKALFTHIGKTPHENLIVIERDMPYFDTPFHFHPECELVYVLSGSGKRIIGDNIEVFGPGDLIFLGPHIPHVWYSDSEYYQGNSGLRSRAIVIYFSKEIFGDNFYRLEETQPLKELFSRSERGLKVGKHIGDQLVPLLRDMPAVHGLKKIVGLLHILECLATSNDTETLASISYQNAYDTKDNHKIDEVFLYLNKHFVRDISMPEVAGLCHMTPQSFCRFFKSRTKSTFVDFLNEIRISHARKLLIETEEHTIAEIAHRSGYKNLSNFNKLFKNKTGVTPKEYKRSLQAKWATGQA